MWSNFLVDGLHFISIRKPDVDVGVFEPEARINVRGDFVIGLHDVLDVDIDEIVEGINMLFYESFYFEECG